MSYNRGRSQSRSRGNTRGRSSFRRGGRSFFDPEVEQAEARKVEEKKIQIEEKKKQEVPKVDQEKKDNIINKGAQWFNKFFGGMKKKERSNIKYEFNQNVDLELAAAYEQRLYTMISSNQYYDESVVNNSKKFIRPYINLLMAIKLYKASTTDDKGLMRVFQSLGNIDIKVPKNLGIILDCLGKTDAANDNVVRMIGQNSVIKNCLFRAIVDSVSLTDKMFDNMQFNDNVNRADIINLRKNHILKESELKLYSADRNGIQLINDRGRDAIDFLNKQDIKLTINANEYSVRLPYLDPDKAGDYETIREWEIKVRGFFTAIKFEYASYIKVMGLALLKWMPLRFILNKNKKFAEIDDRFENTVFAAVKPSEILTQDNWYCVNDFMSDDMLMDNALYLVGYFRQKYEKIYEDNFNMVKFQPSEFGTSSQIVTNHGLRKIWLNDDEYKRSVPVTNNIRPTESYIKMNDEECILGSIFKFNNSVQYESGYHIHLIGKTNEIRNSFITHDFK